MSIIFDPILGRLRKQDLSEPIAGTVFGANIDSGPLVGGQMKTVTHGLNKLHLEFYVSYQGNNLPVDYLAKNEADPMNKLDIRVVDSLDSVNIEVAGHD
ncbi:MAG: hypothetical protein WCO63_01345 [Bacteroidota bacterium]